LDSQHSQQPGSKAQRLHSYYRPITPSEQKLYDYLLYWIERESPTEMLARFQALLITGASPAEPEVRAALKAVIASKLAAEEFRYVLNRCCHILINRWQANPQTRPAILELIKLFETPPRRLSANAAQSASVRRLHQLNRQFTQTDQYQTLTRLSQVLSVAEAPPKQLGTLIRRYPYLYQHCLLSEDSTQEQQQTIQQIQTARQRQFELDLNQYVTDRIRRRPAASGGLDSRLASSSIRSAQNPTLLDDATLAQALRHYVGKIDGRRTCRDQALSLLAGAPASFGGFKDDLYEYLTASIDSGYGKRCFNQHLHQQLQTLLPDSNAQPLNDFLLVRTCSQMLSFLVVDSSQQANHYIFVDLMTNLGAITTTGLLLKVVLLCRKVIPGLEKRFSILFSHYEAHQHEAVQWLVQALENLNLALTTNFGSVTLPLFTATRG
jgi:hypothetical protein